MICSYLYVLWQYINQTLRIWSWLCFFISILWWNNTLQLFWCLFFCASFCSINTLIITHVHLGPFALLHRFLSIRVQTDLTALPLLLGPLLWWIRKNPRIFVKTTKAVGPSSGPSMTNKLLGELLKSLAACGRAQRLLTADTHIPFQLPHQGGHPGGSVRVPGEANEQLADGGVRKKPVDKTDEGEQILFEQCWKQAHQWFTRMRKWLRLKLIFSVYVTNAQLSLIRARPELQKNPKTALTKV